MTKSVAIKSGAKQVKKPVKVRDLPAVGSDADVAVADHAPAATHSGAAPVSMSSGAEFSSMLSASSAGRASSYQAADSMSALSGGSALPVLGGLVVLGGLAAVAAGGGGSSTPPPPPPPPPPPANAAPTVAATQAVAGTEDTASKITVSGSDTNGDTLTYTAAAPANGTVSVSGNVVTYTPKTDFNGADTFKVTVSDGKGGSAEQTVTVNVAAVGETVSVDVTNDTTATTYNAAVDTLGKADNFKFTDDSAKATNAKITNMASGDVIEVTGASSDYSFTSVGNDILVSYNNTKAGVLNQYTLVGLASKGGAVFDEASAETVAGFDFFNALTKSSGNGSGGTAGVGGDLDIDNDGNPLTVATVTATSGADAYKENANVANSVKIVGFGAGDTITVSNAATSAYSFSSVGTDLKIAYSHDGVVNDITLAGVVSAGTFIGNELDAETALGRDFFKDSTSGQTSSSSLDVGTDASRTALSASAGAVTFTDNASVAGNVRISGFGIDDVIKVTGATESQYSFTTGDLDKDGSADDLSIVYNAGSGVVNDIQILNVVSASDFVFDKASAVKAVGFNFITFG